MPKPMIKIEIDMTDLDSLTKKVDVLTEKIDALNQALMKAKENLESLAHYASP